ncbi:LuxR C-terminal-related transcriptional regulator [Amycolatopsis benzoatilytica]|uniref:LuxR C-terminal-related transcriptional regulator n=1 Tax=Amycolatopsis benzoatilytica TaxID=346045 RepID=UPI00039EC8A9|nr:LuxR C-terminal-related transcriptional regulator [Amycolatopsis benzoatilytica]
MDDEAERRQRHPAGPLTSFVGRRRTMALLESEVRACRLVSVTGPGGVGKTRTALTAAERARFSGGTRVVELASVTHPAQVASAVATALGVPDQSNRDATDRVIGHLAGADALLVLDNCEHVLEAAATLVLRLLDALPGLRVLATSREPLGIRGERVHLLAPLAVPEESDASGAGALDHVPAVQLLLDRAQDVLPGFTVTAENRAAVVALCRRLDGLPLAIELAAVRLRSLSVSQIVARLDRRFSLLAGHAPGADPRQRSLRALIDWSHDLCGPDERLLWQRMSVFPAAVDLETAERVCGFGELDGERLFDALDGLVGKSVVVADRRGEQVRYRQFVTLREYGAELLESAGEADLLRRRHRDHFTARAALCVRRWCGPDQASDLSRLREDDAHLLAALAWSAETPGEAPAGARLACLLRYHWIAGGFLSNGRRWLERLLPLLEPGTADRGEALWATAWVALIQGDRAVAGSYLDECAAIADSLNDRNLRGHVRLWRALLNLFAGELDAAVSLYQEAIEIHQATGDTGLVLTASFQLAMAQAYAGRPEEALATCSSVIARASAVGERWNRAYAHWAAAISHLHLGQVTEARTAITAAMRIEQDFRDGVCTALCTEISAWVAASSGHAADAAALEGVAASVWSRLGTSLRAFGPHATEDGRTHARRVDEQLGPAAAAIRQEYAQIALSDAVRIGLDLVIRQSGKAVPSRPAAAGVRTVPDSVLTSRETEIAVLIARGHTNKAIAEQLTISPRTVDGHVERILRKLDCASRSQIASWVTAAGVKSPAR